MAKDEAKLASPNKLEPPLSLEQLRLQRCLRHFALKESQSQPSKMYKTVRNPKDTAVSFTAVQLHLSTWLNGERWADGLQAATVAAARLEPRIDSAMSAGASHRLSGMSEQTLIDSLAHRPADEQAAALEQYRR